MYSVNGAGTTLLGKKDIKSDGSYVATKWFVVFYVIPIFPLGTYRVKKLKTNYHIFPLGLKTQYEMIKISLDMKEILITYLIWWGPIIISIWLIIKFA